LALLAWLAIETADGFRRRDQIVGFFWPDLEQEAARTQLRKALFALRASLGPDTVITRGEGEVRLDPAHLWCDAVALCQLFREGRWAEALALYRGELLDGLFPEGVSQEFEEWLRNKRRLLREQAAKAAWEYSHQEEARGDRKAAAVMARRALELSPDDEGGVRQLMSLLDRQGDRGTALRVYSEWQARLKSEYGVEPAPETRKLARKVQAARKGESHETPPTQSFVAPVPAPMASASAPSSRRPPRRWAVPIALTVLFVLMVGVVALSRGWRSSSGPRSSVAVLPLSIIGDSGLVGAADGLAEELTTALILLDSTLAVRFASRARNAIRQGGDVERIGRSLKVAFVVDGGIQRGTVRVRVTLRLVRSSDATAVWAGSYDLAENPGVTDLQRVAADAAVAIRARLLVTSPSTRP
jgi:DNA-binding SARP family transcriptional activator/TolB-like protein